MIRKNFLLVSTTLVMAATTALASDVIEPRSAETKLASLTGAESTLAQPELLNAQKQAVLSTPLSDTDKLLNNEPESDGIDVFVPETAAHDAIALAIESIVGELYNTGDAVDRKNREAIADFYGERNYQPVWVKDGVLTQEANLLIERLNDAAIDGLDPSDYPVYELDGFEDADSVAGAEMQLTETLLKYARHAQGGRLIPSKVSNGFKNKPVYPEPAEVLVKIANSVDKVAALSSYNPPHRGFKALKAELARMQAQLLAP